MEAQTTTPPAAEAVSAPPTAPQEPAPTAQWAGESVEGIVIQPVQPGAVYRLKELWAYRKLYRHFAREFYERLWKRTILGRVWIAARPLGNMVVGALIFGGLLKAPSNHTPYFLFFLVGQSCWLLLDRSLIWGTRSLYMQRRLLRKMYFPRLILPLAGVTPGLVYYGMYLSLILLSTLGYLIVDGKLWLQIGPQLIVGIFGLLLCLLLAMGITLITSVLGANTRDMRFFVRYITQIWFFFTPIIYPLSAVPAGIRPYAALNPMTSIVELVKWGFIDAGSVRPVGVCVSIGWIVAFWVGGLWFFSRAHATSVDAV
jgi:lipopolysaccharide transport system permease protein